MDCSSLPGPDVIDAFAILDISAVAVCISHVFFISSHFSDWAVSKRWAVEEFPFVFLY